jgi:hypothetical protein
LIDAGWASLEELEVHWSLDDVLSANEVLDAVAVAKQEASRADR